jgi:DNA gyrase subunit A
MALTSVGKMIRVDMQSIRKAGRNTSGVTIVRVDKDDKVVSIAKCPKNKEDGLDISEADIVANNLQLNQLKNENQNNNDNSNNNESSNQSTLL